MKEWDTLKLYKVKGAGKVPHSKQPKRGSYVYSLNAAEPELISKPKRGYERRNISIVHPISQALLCNEIAYNWRSIQKWLCRRLYSLDKIEIGPNYTRGIRGINFELHRAKKGYIEAISDWLVTTDISRFYPSIYTHSIAWAAYGKERIKANVPLYDGSLADRLDYLIRIGNRNQTVGIPIGPETSRIIAEVISSRIERDFAKTQTVFPVTQGRDNIDRYQDDWYVGVNFLENAERILSSIHEVYRGYGLEINGNKTAVERVIAAPSDHWISEIGAFLSHRPGPIRGVRLRELLSLSLRLQKAFVSDPIINYTLAILEAQRQGSGDVEALKSFLLKAAVISPPSMDRICRMILNLQFRTKEVSRKRIRDRFTQLIDRHIVNGNLYEVIWLIYTLRGLRTPFRSSTISTLVDNANSSALALLLSRLEEQRFIRLVVADSQLGTPLYSGKHH